MNGYLRFILEHPRVWEKGKDPKPAQIRTRETRVADHIRSQDPNVFDLIEVESMDVLKFMQEEFLNYNFSMTDGPRSSKEILGGLWQSRFNQKVFPPRISVRTF